MKLSWLDPAKDTPPSTADLARIGVRHEQCAPDSADLSGMLDRIMAERGYLERDEIALTPSTPELDELLAKFAREHLHEDDEVRYVLEGGGIFDLRSADGPWLRVEVGPGDLLVVPARLYHRFFLTDARTIRCVRMFKDTTGWVPHYREAEPAPGATAPAAP